MNSFCSFFLLLPLFLHTTLRLVDTCCVLPSPPYRRVCCALMLECTGHMLCPAFLKIVYWTELTFGLTSELDDINFVKYKTIMEQNLTVRLCVHLHAKRKRCWFIFIYNGYLITQKKKEKKNKLLLCYFTIMTEETWNTGNVILQKPWWEE